MVHRRERAEISFSAPAPFPSSLKNSREDSSLGSCSVLKFETPPAGKQQHWVAGQAACMIDYTKCVEHVVGGYLYTTGCKH